MIENDLLMQFQADVLGVPVVRAEVLETTALGAAYAAGLAVGQWPGPDALRGHWAAGRRWTPQWSDEARDAPYAKWRKAITRSLGWIDAPDDVDR